MRISIVSVAALCGGASAFTGFRSSKRNNAFHMATELDEPFFATVVEPEATTKAEKVAAMEEKGSAQVSSQGSAQDGISMPHSEVPETGEKVMSQSIPFLECPTVLNGALAGDVGFDPLGFAKTEEDLMRYREAEVKHARLAMLAAAGWPLSEVFDRKIAGVLGLNPALDASDRVPSLLNGGLEKISPFYWAAVVIFGAFVDTYGVFLSEKAAGSKKDTGYFPGNFGFDPLGLYPKDTEGQMRMQLAEIKHGRLAMIAVAGYTVQEAVFKTGVVDETPFFFSPIPQIFNVAANSGTVQ